MLNEVPYLLKHLEIAVEKQEIILSFDEQNPPRKCNICVLDLVEQNILEHDTLNTDEVLTQNAQCHH